MKKHSPGAMGREQERFQGAVRNGPQRSHGTTPVTGRTAALLMLENYRGVRGHGTLPLEKEEGGRITGLAGPNNRPAQGMQMVAVPPSDLAGHRSAQQQQSKFADMNSSRNIFIVGFAIFSGLTIPNWVNQNARVMETGISQLDQVIQALLSSGMLMGGFFGFILDNTIPGTPKERGIVAWKQELGGDSDDVEDPAEVYKLPFGIGTRCCTWSWTRYLPFWPQPKREDLSSRNPQDGCITNITDGEMETTE